MLPNGLHLVYFTDLYYLSDTDTFELLSPGLGFRINACVHLCIIFNNYFLDNWPCKKVTNLIHTGGQTLKRTGLGTLTLDDSVGLEELRAPLVVLMGPLES